MSRIKVILQNEQGQRLTCSGELFEKDDERHVTISQDENPSLKVPVVRLMLSPDTIVPANEPYYDFECTGEKWGAVTWPGAF